MVNIYHSQLGHYEYYQRMPTFATWYSKWILINLMTRYYNDVINDTVVFLHNFEYNLTC